MQVLHTAAQAASWLRSRVTGTLVGDSRAVQVGDGFIAWPGARSDGRAFVAQALARGAQACLVEHAGAGQFALDGDDRVAALAGLKGVCGEIAADWFGHSSNQIKVLAVTGTNGKTSTAWWLAQALSILPAAAAVPCGHIGTLGVGVVPVPGSDAATGALQPTGLTTPDPVLLQRSLQTFVQQGLQACAVEASSIGIVEERLQGTQLHTAIITNFTQDHLDYHTSMAAYWQAKRRLFDWPGLTAAVINLDDAQCAALAGELATKPLALWTVSCRQPARLRASEIVFGPWGTRFVVTEGTQSVPLQTELVGHYNVSNLLGVIAAMRTLGVSLDLALQACARLTPVPGRMACVRAPGQPLAVVDYAHTPDALDKVLTALQPIAHQRGGALWCVFGCGGDRDPGKRPLMGAVASRQANRVVLTSDNPRGEAPAAIISQILLGLAPDRGVSVEPDRAAAIAQTLALAAPADVVLIAGKGHEDYQEVAGERRAFSDLQQVRLAQAQRACAVSITPDMAALQDIVAWLDQACVVGNAAVRFARVHTDTRTLQRGDLFVALRGERFDGNDFLSQAAARGAVAALCQGDAHQRLRQAGLPGLVVPDVRLALRQLASGWRSQFRLALIAVTGSNGKTTVTQMIAAILRAYKAEASLATQGNFNNDIGVPLTLLRLRSAHELAVAELGMNHPGEIARLAALARPTVALINNAQREHLEFMTTVQAVANENGCVIDALAASGVAVFPADDEFSQQWLQRAGARATLRFALTPTPGVDVYCVKSLWDGDAWQVQAQTPAGALHYSLRIAGVHNVKNSLAALSCALAAGVPLAAIARGLSAFEPVSGRSCALRLSIGVQTLTLVDDTYNANPDSVRSAIDVLAALPGPRLLVLGDMGEVGSQGEQFHAQAGDYARQLGIEHLMTLGDLSVAASAAFGAGRHFDAMPDLCAAVLRDCAGLGSMLVKGSRFMAMERVVQAVAAHAQEQGTPPHAA